MLLCLVHHAALSFILFSFEHCIDCHVISWLLFGPGCKFFQLYWLVPLYLFGLLCITKILFIGIKPLQVSIRVHFLKSILHLEFSNCQWVLNHISFFIGREYFKLQRSASITQALSGHQSLLWDVR